MIPLLFLLLLLLHTPRSEFVSLVQYAGKNCTETEYAYGTRCICTWDYVCESNACNWIINTCDRKATPFCTNMNPNDATAAVCTGLEDQSTSGLTECVPNQMTSQHCLCGTTICPTSIFTTSPTFEIIAMNYCSTDKTCVRNDYASYTAFPFNGEITGADPTYTPGSPAVHTGGGPDGDSR